MRIPITHHIWRCTTISELMINEQIRDKEVRLIGENGEQLGIMSAREAMQLAREAELDLVKIAPTAKPPVCKIIDYGKYRDNASPFVSQHRYQRLEHQDQRGPQVSGKRRQCKGDAALSRS